MHELSVMKALIDAVKGYQQQHAQAVKAIRIEVGKLTCIDSERLKFCFDLLREDEGLRDTQLRIDTVTATAKCQGCGKQMQLHHFGQACDCGSFENEILTGNELNLTEIEFL
ncbi:MAG: hydrogenase maturation nickel metallochaperone HypA [Aestuariibacter sp.]